MDDFRIKKAAYNEMKAIIALSCKFHAESNFSQLTRFSPNKLEENLYLAWANKPCNFITLCVFRDEIMAGYAHVTRDDFATEESTGSIYQFYILPEYRGTGAARALRDAVEDQFNQWDCKLKYVECGCGFDNEQNDVLFSNLWSKIGYKFIGTLLFKGR